MDLHHRPPVFTGALTTELGPVVPLAGLLSYYGMVPLRWAGYHHFHCWRSRFDLVSDLQSRFPLPAVRSLLSYLVELQRRFEPTPNCQGQKLDSTVLHRRGLVVRRDIIFSDVVPTVIPLLCLT